MLEVMKRKRFVLEANKKTQNSIPCYNKKRVRRKGLRTMLCMVTCPDSFIKAKKKISGEQTVCGIAPIGKLKDVFKDENDIY